MSNKDKIRSLIEKRDDLYNRVNREIYQTIDQEVLEVIAKFLMKKKECGNISVQWEDFHLLGNIATIVITAYMEMYDADEEMVGTFFIHIPIDLLLTGNPEEVFAFLERTNTEEEQQLGFIKQIDEEQPTKEEQALIVDSKMLTEEQQKQLLMFCKLNKEKPQSRH